MHKENKFLVNDRGIIEEVKVIFDDENNPYVYSFLNEDDFVRFDKDEKFFDNREQAEEYVKENIIPFDKNKVNALKGIFCINGMTFRKEEVAYIKNGELYWVEITLREGTKVTPRNEDENIIISWSFGGNPSGVHYTSIKKPVETEEE